MSIYGHFKNLLFLDFLTSDDPADNKNDASSSEDEEETAQEKKLRLTKQYLSQLKQDG